MSFQRVDAAEDQRVVGGDHGKVDLVFVGERDDLVDLGRTDRNADGVLGDAAVSRQTVDRLDRRILFEFPDQSVFAAAPADNEQFHIPSVRPVSPVYVS